MSDGSDHTFEPLSRLGDEFSRASRSETQSSWRRGQVGAPIRLTRPAIAALLVLCVFAVAAVPSVRAGLGNLGGTLVGYFDSDEPPGRPVESSDSPPAWLNEDGNTGQRVIASANGYQLFLVRQASGTYTFSLDDSAGIGDSAAGWERQFADSSVVVLGPGTRPDASGRFPLYGVTAGDVAEVELRYEDGPTSSAPAHTGGFVLMMDPARRPVELVALDQDGQVLQTVDAQRYARD